MEMKDVMSKILFWKIFTDVIALLFIDDTYVVTWSRVTCMYVQYRNML